MRRWALALAVPVLLAPGINPAAAASYAGTGVVTGGVTYGRPLPGVLNACAAKLPVAINLSSPGFTLKTPSGVQVVPLTVAASGVAFCDSEAGGGAPLTVAIQAGGLRCDLRGGYTHIGPHYTLIASDRSCSYDGDGDGVAEATAPGYSWLFELTGTAGTLAGSVVYQPY